MTNEVECDGGAESCAAVHIGSTRDFRASIESVISLRENDAQNVGFQGLYHHNSPDVLYRQIDRLVRHGWTEAACGDGVCESPFEFPAFHRFGCQADCGFAAVAARVTPIHNTTQQTNERMTRMNE